MYQCKGCGAGLRFDIASQLLKCDQCGSEYDPYLAKPSNEATETTDAFDVTTFTCPQCGGEIMSLDNTAAGFCNYCGTHTTLSGRITKLAKPSYIIPFKITKEDCKKEYLKTARHAIYAPKELKDKSHIDSFRGIYMPYWLYDVTQKGPFLIHGETTHRSGDYDITKHFDLTGVIDNEFDGIPFDSSSSFADNISERIVPYNEKEMKPFTPSFLSGFYSDGADVQAGVYTQDAVEFASNATVDSIKQDPVFKPYTIKETDGHIERMFNTEVKPAEAAIFPVWFLSYRNGDRVAYAAVNGQTGKVSADLPASITKFSIGSILCAIPIFLLLTFFFTFTPSTLVTITGVMSLITMIVYAAAQSALDKRDNGTDDKGARAAKKNGDKKKKSNKLSWPALISVIIAVIFFFADPYSDIICYSAAIAAAIAEFIALFILVKHYNQLATRPLPQFNYKGGDDRA